MVFMVTTLYVTVQQNPLLVAVRSALECYPREVMGGIYGDTRPAGWVIDNAQPVQQVRVRGCSGIENTERSGYALELGTGSLDTMLGTFHSHTRYPHGAGTSLPLLRLS
ncbi:MAG TPA: hypothetical protein VJC16_00680 [Candidatus Nanoarchaeia archaeon]|nr:hypothetical protein [Candidatus Nanoarchaeia archaeon]